jgi:hypothetical protein
MDLVRVGSDPLQLLPDLVQAAGLSSAPGLESV